MTLHFLKRNNVNALQPFTITLQVTKKWTATHKNLLWITRNQFLVCSHCNKKG